MTKSTPRKRRQSPVIQARNALWAKRYEAGETVAEIARTVGLSETAVYQGLTGLVEPRPQGRRWTLPVVPRRVAPKPRVVATPSERVWCEQRDRRIHRAEAAACRSPFCKGTCR